MSVYYDKRREWNKIIDRAMAVDFSWKASAAKYEEMYNWLAPGKIRKLRSGFPLPEFFMP